MKASKRLISIIFTLMMLFVGIAAIHAEEIITENIKLLETIEINNGDVGSDELVPMSANECIYYPSKFIGTPGSSTEEYTSKGEKYVIKFGSDGYAQYYIHYSDHGSPAHHVNPHYHTFGVVNGSWAPTEYYPGLPN